MIPYCFNAFLKFRKQVVILKNISILGSTGSIGKQTLEIVDENPGRFRVVALTF